MPSQSRRRRQEILKRLEPLSVLVQTVPDYTDVVSGNATVTDVRDVDANDLLGRDPIPPNGALSMRAFATKSSWCLEPAVQSVPNCAGKS